MEGVILGFFGLCLFVVICGDHQKNDPKPVRRTVVVYQQAATQQPVAQPAQ